METLILPPFPEFDPVRDITQFFGVNPASYAKYGIPGHNAIDAKRHNAANMSYGIPLVAQHDAVSFRWEEDFPANQKGAGVWLRGKLKKPLTIHNRTATWIETVHWHVSDITLKTHTKDDTGKRRVPIGAGDVVALMGNTGQVRPKPTQLCPHCGTHTHNGIRFYEDTTNGLRMIPTEYDGYCDPLMWMHKTGWKYNMRFTRNLYLGARGDDVSWLQSLLKIDLRTTDYEPLGRFGPKTLRDVMAFQRKYNISPAAGFFWPKTREKMHKLYTIYG